MNRDAEALKLFSRLAPRWWDPEGDSKTLHDINPARLGFIKQHAKLQGAMVLDVGCGGGILSESLAANGASVTGIDLSEEVLDVARLHLHESGLTVDYRNISAEDLALQAPAQFDAVVCMEMLEHVPDPKAVLQACATLLKPQGKLFLSTLNRNFKSFALGIVAAEYVLGLVPKGTHQYAQFIRPSELAAWLRGVGDFEIAQIKGMTYNPVLRRAYLSDNIDINYLLVAEKRR